MWSRLFIGKLIAVLIGPAILEWGIQECIDGAFEADSCANCILYFWSGGSKHVWSRLFNSLVESPWSKYPRTEDIIGECHKPEI